MPNNLIIRGARVNNLKNINLEIPKNKLVVITGLSGSGKSSLAFDTIYAEGQRRYAESLSSYARQFMEMQDKPDVDEIRGLSPTIAIDQRANTQNPRSTVGTVTEIYDHLRLLFARAGAIFCSVCKVQAIKLTPGQIVEKIRVLIKNNLSIKILSPLVRMEKKSLEEIQSIIETRQIKKLRFDNKYYTADEFLGETHAEAIVHNLEIIVGEVNRENERDLTRLVEIALELGNGLVIVNWGSKEKDEELLSTHWRCPKCGKRFPDLEPNQFSFNSPRGACPKCTGLGITLEADPELIIPNKRLTLEEGAVKPWVRITGNQSWYMKLLKAVAEENKFPMDKAALELNKNILSLILYGTGSKLYKVDNKEVVYEGVINDLERRHRETDSDYVRKEIEDYMREKICSLCNGRRLKDDSLAVKVFGKNISEITFLPLSKLKKWFEELSKNKVINYNIVDPILKEILKRLNDLSNVGLDYVALNRSITTLSGGESERVRLSTQLSTGLTGVIYILDEPSIGLHPRDMERLIETLENLRDLGNTVIVVEHDFAMMKRADFIIDIGPGAGVFGGEIVAKGTPKEIMKNKKSLTGAYLSGRAKVELDAKPHVGNGKFITIQKASGFNLKNIDIKIPLGKLVCVSGVSGSGKSTLVIETLGKALANHFYRAKDLPAPHKAILGLDNVDKVIMIDQSPIGRTPRSNPATYTNIFTFIRDLFTEIPEAKMRGYDAGKFSFNVKGGGRCEACAGEGYVRIPMQFLTDVFVLCPECQGKRYTADVLEIHYKNKNIVDVLNMNILEAREFFNIIPAIADKLQILVDVGLGYLQLGQPATKLSGGEAQRVKLAAELSKRATGRTFYILDEPTTGLHFEDIKQLLKVLNQLVDKGNTVLIIEHNPDILRNADWIIDLGPEGGDKGGEIVAEGTAKEIMKIKKSFTGAYLKGLASNTKV